MEPSRLSLVVCVNGLYTKAHSMPQDKNAVYLSLVHINISQVKSLYLA